MKHIQVYCLDALLNGVAPTISGYLGRHQEYLSDAALHDVEYDLEAKQVVSNLDIKLLYGATKNRPFSALSVSQTKRTEPFGIRGSAFNYGINSVLLKVIAAELVSTVVGAELEDDETALKNLPSVQDIFESAHIRLTPKAVSRFLQLNTVKGFESIRASAFGHVYTVAPKSTLDMTSKLQVVKLLGKIPLGPDKIDLDFMNAVLVASREAFQAMIAGQLKKRKWDAKSGIPLTPFFAFLEKAHRMVLSKEAREKCAAITRTGISVDVDGHSYYVTLVDAGKELVIQAKRA